MANRTIRVCGLDPSLRNWGVAIGSYDIGTRQLTLEKLEVIQTTLVKNKQVRTNSLDLDSALQLYKGAIAAVTNAHAVFVEVPVGSQSAAAMKSYGICIGVLASLRANGSPFFEVSPTEVKLAGPGKKTATKWEMITWAMETHPEGNWPKYKSNGDLLVNEGKAEHMADAVAAIYAGLASNPFQQTLPFLVT